VHDVVIVGGGPVGLYLANALVERGLDIHILEKRARRTGHSRAIGIHPPSLTVFDDIGIADEIITGGVRIREGVFRCTGREWACLNFDNVSPHYPFVLSLPQHDTEHILESTLKRHSPQVLQKNAIVHHVRDHGTHVTVDAHTGGTPLRIAARFVVGADGGTQYRAFRSWYTSSLHELP
jgi:2-polyprenyl-6-methoxyphenol hydroxylase-like FAD-dependent oxidoreductase